MEPHSSDSSSGKQKVRARTADEVVSRLQTSAAEYDYNSVPYTVKEDWLTVQTRMDIVTSRGYSFAYNGPMQVRILWQGALEVWEFKCYKVKGQISCNRRTREVDHMGYWPLIEQENGEVVDDIGYVVGRGAAPMAFDVQIGTRVFSMECKKGCICV